MESIPGKEENSDLDLGNFYIFGTPACKLK
jgi:hypothetical protein